MALQSAPRVSRPWLPCKSSPPPANRIWVIGIMVSNLFIMSLILLGLYRSRAAWYASDKNMVGSMAPLTRLSPALAPPGAHAPRGPGPARGPLDHFCWRGDRQPYQLCHLPPAGHHLEAVPDRGALVTVLAALLLPAAPRARGDSTLLGRNRRADDKSEWPSAQTDASDRLKVKVDVETAIHEDGHQTTLPYSINRTAEGDSGLASDTSYPSATSKSERDGSFTESLETPSDTSNSSPTSRRKPVPKDDSFVIM